MEKLSIVVPMYNEEDNVDRFYKAVKPVMESLSKQYDHEIIFIDDGSKDKTLKRLKALAMKDEKVKVLVFGRNFGQTPAMSAGLDNCTGDIVITMDGDLQNDPKDIPAMLMMLHDQDLDVVSGWRYDRHDPGLSKKLPSKLSNKIARYITELPLHDFGCSLKLYRKESLADVRLYGEMHRYIPALVAWNGFKVGEMKVTHHARKFGQTKYGMKRLMRGFLDLLTIKFWNKFATRPLHFFGSWGLVFFGVGFLIGAVKLGLRIAYIFNENWGQRLEAGPLLLFSVMLMVMGIQLFMFGFLGDMIIRTYYSNDRNKIYTVRSIISKKQ